MSPTHTRRLQSMFKLFRRIITVGSVAVDDKKDLVWTGPHINVLVFSSQIPLAPPINVRSFRRVFLNLSHKMRLVTDPRGKASCLSFFPHLAKTRQRNGWSPCHKIPSIFAECKSGDITAINNAKNLPDIFVALRKTGTPNGFTLAV